MHYYRLYLNPFERIKEMKKIWVPLIFGFGLIAASLPAYAYGDDGYTAPGGLYTGPGGGASTGPNGGMSTGPGGGLSTGPGGGLSTGPGGGLSTGPGGGLSTGPGGGLSTGPGGGLSTGSGGGLSTGTTPYYRNIPPRPVYLKYLKEH